MESQDRFGAEAYWLNPDSARNRQLLVKQTVLRYSQGQPSNKYISQVRRYLIVNSIDDDTKVSEAVYQALWGEIPEQRQAFPTSEHGKHGASIQLVPPGDLDASGVQIWVVQTVWNPQGITARYTQETGKECWIAYRDDQRLAYVVRQAVEGVLERRSAKHPPHR